MIDGLTGNCEEQEEETLKILIKARSEIIGSQDRQPGFIAQYKEWKGQEFD